MLFLARLVADKLLEKFDRVGTHLFRAKASHDVGFPRNWKLCTTSAWKAKQENLWSELMASSTPRVDMKDDGKNKQNHIYPMLS